MSIQQIIEQALSKLSGYSTNNPDDVKEIVNQITDELSDFKLVKSNESLTVNIAGIINNTLNRCDSYCTDSDDDRKVLSDALVGALSDYDVQPLRKRNWECDFTQFGRLLAEIRAFGLTDDQYAFLRESMNVENEEVDEILERAEASWEITKYGEKVTTS